MNATESSNNEDEPIEIKQARLADEMRAGFTNEEFRRIASDIDENTFEKVESVKRPSKNYWKRTRIGRFLSGRTKAGRVFRRVGIGAVTVGAGMLGIDTNAFQLGVEQAVSGSNGDMIRALEIIYEIVLAIGAIITAVTKGADLTENYGEKADELEQQEGKKTAIRAITDKTNQMRGN